MGIKKYIADMETNGIYFPDEVKEVLETRRVDAICEYSGLPSVSSYLQEEYFYIGHS
jgi:hypothetical protein